MYSPCPVHQDPLAVSDGPPDPRSPLTCVEALELLVGLRRGFLHNLIALGEDQFDVAGAGHVWVDLSNQSHESACTLKALPQYIIASVAIARAFWQSSHRKPITQHGGE